MNIVTISNITTEPFLAKSLSKHFTNHRKIAYKTLPLEEIYNDTSKAILHSADYIIVLIHFSEHLEFVSFDTRDKATHDLHFDMISKKSLALYDYLKHHSQGCISWFGYDGYNDKLKYIVGHKYLRAHLIDDVNGVICKLIYEEDTYINLKAIISELGIDNAYSHKNKYRWNARIQKNCLSGSAVRYISNIR